MQNDRLKKILDERSLLLSKEKQKKIEQNNKEKSIQDYRNWKITCDTGDSHATCTLVSFPPITETKFIPYQTTTDSTGSINVKTILNL